MAVVSSPTTRGRRLAFELRKFRERAELTPSQAARQLGWSLSKLIRIEKAQTQPKTSDITAALALYGVDSATHAALIQLAKESWKRGWWTAYADVFSGSIVALEDEASSICAWEPQLVPGLLQTEEYAHGIISLRSEDPATIHRRVMARMNRGMLLRRPDAPRLHAVLDEAVLRRGIGGPEVMRKQFSALVEAAQRPNVTIQIMPFDSGAHLGLEGSMELLGFADDAELDVAYAEGPMGDIYLESAEEVTRIRLALETICSAAMPPAESVHLIAALAQDGP
ncbi:helix-turn-helix domain-containing protein [Actinomadura rugatobispora]|uniref:Helix-turn-helix domain-containing protein n=1 Tax=Actinomadura rugatobispora TaxID=1994 RepID=A0ABW1A3F7_9ACTN|nr:helix-turn-helix transcriptional regulator [Actinomadura rugatobispora]